ncbi:MAG: hypothetical protein AB4058_06935 [Microcystaceae cyanobacterium]
MMSSETENTHPEIREYVANLQLHMTLHARKLVPNLDNTSDSRSQMLHESQAHLEKIASRYRI